MNILQQKTIKISILGYCQTYTNIAIEWGREHKKFAVDINLLKARELHPPLTYQETGDKLSGKSPPNLGASPDGLVDCPGCYRSEVSLQL